MNSGVKQAFSKIKTEMDQHLDTINQNTNEIQACYEYLAELDAKLEKMNERLDEIQYRLEPSYQELERVHLTPREQEVFLVMYAVEDPITTADIARRLGLTIEMVEQYLTNISAQGVPVLKSFVNGKVYHSLDLKFKDLQARKNILQISDAVRAQVLVDKAI